MPETLPAVVAEAIPAHLRRRSRGVFVGRGGAWVIGLSVLVSLLALLPIAFVVGLSVQPGWTTLLALVFRPRVGELFINTVLLVLFTIPLCVALGVTLAWLTERSEEEIEYGGGTVRALRLCFESEAGGETIQCTLWFGADDAPLRAEIAEKDKITAYMEFTSFAFCDTIAADESEAGG